MKKIAIFLLLLIAFGASSQGKFAPPEWKTLIGKSFLLESEIPGITSYQSRGGTTITDAGDPEPLSVSWFSNSNSILVLFEQFDSQKKGFHVLDVLLITNTTSNQEIKAGECRSGPNDDASIVALVQTSEAKRVKAIKSWLFNRDKIRIETWPVNDVTCLGAVGDD